MTASLKKLQINKNKWLMGHHNLQNMCLFYALYPKLHKNQDPYWKSNTRNPSLYRYYHHGLFNADKLICPVKGICFPASTHARLFPSAYPVSRIKKILNSCWSTSFSRATHMKPNTQMWNKEGSDNWVVRTVACRAVPMQWPRNGRIY
jgi:hypothetical protein